MENENVIEWITGDKQITVTTSQRKYVNKIKKLAEKFPDMVIIISDGKNGVLLAKLPIECLKLSIIESGLSDEQKLASAERLKAYHQSKRDNFEDGDLDD